jgi:2-oxoglutarate dehydrogenase E2 component (dihydrolipoamide succinyltransferase)
MAVSVPMPRLGESVSEGTVTRWLKKEGERVEADEPLLEVSTDKVDTEIPSPASGIVASIKVQEDETVEVGVELAVIDDGSGGAAEAPAAEAAPAPEPEPTPPPAAPAPSAPAADSTRVEAGAGSYGAAPPPAAAPAPQPVPQAAQPQPEAPSAPAPVAGSGSEGAYVTPLVRKLAAEHGVDLSRLQGTGVGGRIRKQDVLDAAQQTGSSAPAAAAPPAPAPAAAPAAAAPSAPAAQIAQPAQQASAPAPAYAAQATAAAPATQVRGRTEELSRLRKVIAARMTESLQTSAQLTTVVEADVTRIARLRAQAKPSFEAREGVKLSFLPFFALATVEALKAHPVVNSSIDQDAGTVTYHEGEHLGIAVDTDRGLLVPVLHNAGDLNLAGMARKIADIAERTRTNTVTPDELGGGTFTLTNTGSRGALFDTPIINQPQVGILGTGSVVKRAVVVDDPELGEVIAIRSMVYLALTYDHRIVDGADAARFLVTVKQRLEEGDFAAELGL